MDQSHTPLYNGLLKHYDKRPLSFHVPGHKYGGLFPKHAKASFSEILKIDATELSGLDDLHAAEEIIKEAQELTSRFYHVKNSYFLVGGSTAGNLAMILATCPAGSTVFVQRNCHKSIIHGLQLAGVNPVFLQLFFNENGTIPVGVSVETIQQAIHTFPNVTSLILTYPNYYGMAATNLEDIITIAHQHNICVLVDEAHGAHFNLCHPAVPITSIKLGADVIVHSAHKTLPAMTMGSFLHVNNNSTIDVKKLEFYLQVVQSSSPSYPIMASLDIARFYLANLTNEELHSIIDDIQDIKNLLREIPQIIVVEETSEYMIDPLKLVLQINCGLSGYELQDLFGEQSIFLELADPNYVLMVLPLGGLTQYKQSISKISDVLRSFPPIHREIGFLNTLPQLSFTTLEIPFMDMEKYKIIKINLNDAVGFICAANVIPYPPGIPIVMKGEKITKGQIQSIKTLKEKNAKFQGGEDIYLDLIEVFLIK